MTTARSQIPFVLAVVLYLFVPCYGQWRAGGVLLGSLTPVPNAELDAVNIGNGNIVVAWDRPRDPNYDIREIRVQCVDSAGYCRWPRAGVIVCPDISTWQLYPMVLPDDSGGVYVFWSDWRHNPAEGVALYGQRLDSLGNKLWDGEGIRLTYGQYSFLLS